MSLTDYCEGSGKFLFLGNWTASGNETDSVDYQDEFTGMKAQM